VDLPYAMQSEKSSTPQPKAKLAEGGAERRLQRIQDLWNEADDAQSATGTESIGIKLSRKARSCRKPSGYK